LNYVASARRNLIRLRLPHEQRQFADSLIHTTVSLHSQFNHNDLFHVVQMIGFYLFYRS